MSLIVEDGTGKPDAESYASVAQADDFQAKMGNTAWSVLSTEAKEQALRRSTRYMEQVYRLLWQGYRYLDTQRLSWPRERVERQDLNYLREYNYYRFDEIPQEVVEACIDLALKASFGDLAPDLDRPTIREKVSSIEVEYDKNAPQYVRYRAIDNLLAPFLRSSAGGASRSLVRA